MFFVADCLKCDEGLSKTFVTKLEGVCLGHALRCFCLFVLHCTFLCLLIVVVGGGVVVIAFAVAAAAAAIRKTVVASTVAHGRTQINRPNPQQKNRLLTKNCW